MKRKTISLMIMILMLAQVCFAFESPILMRINDQFVQTQDALTERDGQIYMEARTFGDSIGAITEWLEANQTAHFYIFGKRIIISDGAISTYVDDAPVDLPAAASYFIEDGRIYMPVQFMAEFFGCTYNWQADLRVVDIDFADAYTPDELIAPAENMRDDLLWLARIINVEARGGSLYKKIAVGNVVINRLNNPNFPSSVYDVIKANGQFPPAYYSYFDSFTPTLESYVAAMHAINGVNIVDDCLYFNLKPFSWKPQSDFYGEIEGDYFYR